MPPEVDPLLRPFLDELARPRPSWTGADAAVLAAVFLIAASFAFTVATGLAIVLRWTLAADYGEAVAAPVGEGTWRWVTAAVAGTLATVSVVAAHDHEERSG